MKQIRIYKLAQKGPLHFPEDAALRQRFQPGSPTTEKTVGWVPPRNAEDEHGVLVEAVAEHRILQIAIERRAVPGSALAKAVRERCKLIEKDTGRKPGRKETREIKEEIKLAMLARVIPTISTATVWIDTKKGRMMVGSTSNNVCDSVATLLLETFHTEDSELCIQPLNVDTSPVTAMSTWLMEMEPPDRFSIDRSLELKSADESKAVVRFTRHSLDVSQVVDHLRSGMQPTALAMTFDDRVSFTLTQGLDLKGVSFLDSAVETNSSSHGDVDAFDANQALLTGELTPLIDQLIAVLGGEPTDI